MQNLNIGKTVNLASLSSRLNIGEYMTALPCGEYRMKIGLYVAI